ncbi:hypothetical protein PTKIN_Ptkin10aG0108200 [Pterospermum kingtungense]
MDLEAQLDNLEVDGAEEEEFDLDIGGDVKQVGRVDLCLVGRFLTESSINYNAMSSRLAKIWKPGRGFHIKDISEHRLQTGMVPTSIPLYHIDIWVQIYEVLVGISQKEFHKFIRVRIRLDVRLPLKRFKKIKGAEGMARVTFKYDRLPTFCFICGLLGHMDKFCPKLFAFHDVKVDIKREWSSKLRVLSKKVVFGGNSRWLRDEADGLFGGAEDEDDGSYHDMDRVVGEDVAEPVSNSSFVGGKDKGKLMLTDSFNQAVKLGVVPNLLIVVAKKSTEDVGDADLD